MNKNVFLRVLLFVGMVLYVVSPVDLMPGLLVDDAIIVVAGIIAAKKLKNRNR